MSITPLPPAPAITDTTSEFNTKAFNFVAALTPFGNEANELLETCEDAAGTASAAIAVVGAVAWVSGTTYAIGDPVYSPIDLQTYRRKTVGAGTTDPSADATNWEKVAINAPTATQAEMEAGTSTTVKSVTPERIKQAIIALTPPPAASGSLLRVTTFTSSGTWTKGAGTNFVRVRMVGGGGGGGGCSSGFVFGGGGGGGGYCEEFISTSGVSTETVTIGALGSGGTSTEPRDGSAGGTTSFGAFCSASGGQGGAAGDGNPQTTGAGNLGGVGSGGNINSRGGAGGPRGYGANGGANTGMGGSSMFGGGALPIYGTGGTVASDAYGAGGAGAWSAGAARAGGNGSAGILIVEEYT